MRTGPTPVEPLSSLPSLGKSPAADSDMSRLISDHPWEGTPLGPREAWPHGLRTAVDILVTSRFPMWMGWGPDLVFLYNDAYRRMTLGEKHPWALGRPAREVWSEIWPEIGPRITRVTESGEATWDESLQLFLERSGYQEETYHTFSYSPLKGDDGRIAGMLCVVSEETERVIGERRMSCLRELATGLAETTGEADVLATVERVLDRYQGTLPFTLTYLFEDDPTRARLASATGIERGHPAAPELLTADDAVWRVGDFGSGPIVIENLPERFPDLPKGVWSRRPDRALVAPIARAGQEAPAGFLVAATNPYRPLDGAYTGFVLLVAGQIASSIANARAYEDERRRAESLRELDRAKTTFFSNVSHELRTPLTLLIGPLQDLLERADLPAGEREEIELAHRNAGRLLKLVNGLLDFARIEAGRVQASYQPTDLGSYTAELASSFRSACERAGLRLTVETSPLPGDVYLDRDMWEKVVLNLISNAFKHTFEGEIAIRVDAVDGWARLRVSDTGVGIAADQLPRIFDRFHRVPNARSRTYEGTGIGLALVQELARRHGGRIEVESREGEGTTFTVLVPFGSEHLPGSQVREAEAIRPSRAADAFVDEALRWLPAERSERSREGDGSRSAETNGSASPAAARIVLADDNADMREYVARLLRAEGWSVRDVADGAAALEAIRSAPPDLVLSDVMMPRLDGFGLLREIRGDPRLAGLPVVLLSARAGEEARVEGAEAGADEYLVKPFSARELVARVEALLGISRARREAESALREEAELLRTIERIGGMITAELDVERIVQAVTDEATGLTGAQFGAFFYNLIDADGESYTLYTISGVPREAFSRFPMPRNTAVFEPTFRGRGIVRSGDIRKDPRYGHNSPHYGMPAGHLPVVSYLAVPVVSPSGEVLGGLFFGHERPDVFDERAERLVAGISGWAALAIDNARLYQSERDARERLEVAVGDARAAQADAERANEVKSQFLATISHELRTPLNAIQGHVQLIEMGIHGPVTGAQADALGRVQRSQQHLLSLINDVLNFTRLEAGRVEYDLQAHELAPVVRDTVAMLEVQMRERELAFESRVAPTLKIRADREKFQQILINLLSNAIKFTAPGGRIAVEARTEDDAEGLLRVHVSDTGCGIPGDKLEAIFDPFVQVRSQLTQPNARTGLGLSISRDLARGMGGDLVVRSVEGKGSVFTVVVPSV